MSYSAGSTNHADRIPALDAIRGLAIVALGVMLSGLLGAFSWRYFESSILRYFRTRFPSTESRIRVEASLRGNE